MKVVVGEPIPLNLQLYDGRDDMQPEVVLYSSEGERLGRRVLIHFGNGLYLDKSFLMPDTEEVVAQYEVKKDRRPVDDYEIVTETFYAVQPEKPAPKFAIGRLIEQKTEGGKGRLVSESPVS